MPKIFTSKNQKIGELGEDLAVKYLIGKGFTIIERNLTKKWGEIDIIAMKQDKLYFIEVKSVSMQLIEGQMYETLNSNVSHETFNGYRPEENMHPIKVRKIFRTVESFLVFDASRYIPDYSKKRELLWQLDLLCVYIDRENKKARVKVIENIIG